MEVFEGPQLQPPRISLISAAELITPTSEKWYQAFDLILEGCGLVYVFPVCTTEGQDGKEFEGKGVTGVYQPYVIYTTDKCSTWPAGREFYDRAQRKLIAGESALLAEILWTGAHGPFDLTAGQTVNPTLADTAFTLTGAATSPEKAIGRLDQELGVCSGGRSMIHVRPQVLPTLLYRNAIRREGNMYLSPMDNIVVADAGYPGTGPAPGYAAAGATEWMYGSNGMVQVRRGAVIRLGEDDLASQVSRLTNDRQVVVERVAHAALDASCCVFAIEITY